MVSKKLTVVFLLLVISGCSASSEEMEGVHPDPTRFPPDEEVDYTIDISKRSEAPLPHFFHPGSLQITGIIGDGSDLADEYHDTPHQVDMDAQGNIYITQEQEHSSRIRVYDSEGQFKYSIGQRGRGPGEFGRIFSFTFNEDYRQLYVLDIFEIEVFTMHDGRFEYYTSIEHNMILPYDMCLLGNNLFLSGYEISRDDMEASENEDVHKWRLNMVPPIHKYNLEPFEHVNSFGYIYSSYSGWGNLDGRLSETLISCNESTGTVVGYLKHYPYIFGYDQTGRRKWVSKMEGYKSTRSEETETPEGPSFYLHMNEEIFHYKEPTQKIYNNEYELLQFTYAPLVKYFATPEAKENSMRTILVNTGTGELFHSDAYKYIGVWKNNRVLTMEIDPETFQKTFQLNELP